MNLEKLYEKFLTDREKYELDAVLFGITYTKCTETGYTRIPPWEVPNQLPEHPEN